MSKQRTLTGDQERQRTDGLRVLARIIARRHLANAELVPAPTGDTGGRDVRIGKDCTDAEGSAHYGGDGERKEAAE